MTTPDSGLPLAILRDELAMVSLSSSLREQLPLRLVKGWPPTPGCDWGALPWRPADLVCFGPQLPAAIVAEVEELFATHLGEHHFGLSDPPNEPCTYNGVDCYATMWMYGVAP